MLLIIRVLASWSGGLTTSTTISFELVLTWVKKQEVSFQSVQFCYRADGEQPFSKCNLWKTRSAVGQQPMLRWILWLNFKPTAVLEIWKCCMIPVWRFPRLKIKSKIISSCPFRKPPCDANPRISGERRHFGLSPTLKAGESNRKEIELISPSSLYPNKFATNISLQRNSPSNSKRFWSFFADRIDYSGRVSLQLTQTRILAAYSRIDCGSCCGNWSEKVSERWANCFPTVYTRLQFDSNFQKQCAPFGYFSKQLLYYSAGSDWRI